MRFWLPYRYCGAVPISTSKNQEKTQMPPLHVSLPTPILAVILWLLWLLKVAEVQCQWAAISVVVLKPLILISESGEPVLNLALSAL
jgi:hypothetical protein